MRPDTDLTAYLLLRQTLANYKQDCVLRHDDDDHQLTYLAQLQSLAQCQRIYIVTREQ